MYIISLPECICIYCRNKYTFITAINIDIKLGVATSDPDEVWQAIGARGENRLLCTQKYNLLFKKIERRWVQK